MHITARLSNSGSTHTVEVATNGRSRCLQVPAKSAGSGSSINGGELLLSALATCFCNDLYREAVQRDIVVRKVEVEVEATFGQPGEPTRYVSYHVRVDADADPAAVDALIRATDAMSEIHNTLRAGCPVELQRA
jgi:uncharacterized OsmC-like protein